MKTFFIAGVQRSGTTLLSVILSKHPEIYLDGYSVAFRLISCFNNYSMVLPDNAQYSRKELLTWLIENDYRGRLAGLLDYENIDQYPNIRALIEASIQQRLDQNQKAVWGDKAPNLQHYLSDILRLMPETKIIHIIRDGRATAFSFAQRAYKNIYLAAQEWVDGNVLAFSNQELIGRDNYQIIYYEDLLRNPEKTIQAVCSFLDIDFHPEMLKLNDGQSSEEEAQNYVKSTFDQSKIDQYKNQLSPKVIKKIEQIQGPMLKKMGYPLHHDHQVKDFQYLSTRRRIWLNQKDNIKKLFRSQKVGMQNRKNIEVKVPFKKRLYNFLFVLGYDLLSERIFKVFFRRSYVKDKYLRK